VSLAWFALWPERLKTSSKWRALGNDAVAKGTYLELLMAVDRDPRSPHCGMLYRSLDDTGPVPYPSIRSLAGDLGIHHRTLPSALECLKRVGLMALRGGIPELTGFRELARKALRKLVNLDQSLVKVAGKVDHKVDQRNTGKTEKSFPVDSDSDIPSGEPDGSRPPKHRNPDRTRTPDRNRNPTLGIFEALYEEVHGRPYVWDGFGKAGRLLGDLREKIGAATDEAWAAFVRRFLEDRDPKLVEAGHPYAWLPTRANRYLAAAATPKPRRRRSREDLEAGARRRREYEEQLKAEGRR